MSTPGGLNNSADGTIRVKLEEIQAAIREFKDLLVVIREVNAEAGKATGGAGGHSYPSKPAAQAGFTDSGGGVATPPDPLAPPISQGVNLESQPRSVQPVQGENGSLPDNTVNHQIAPHVDQIQVGGTRGANTGGGSGPPPPPPGASAQSPSGPDPQGDQPIDTGVPPPPIHRGVLGILQHVMESAGMSPGMAYVGAYGAKQLGYAAAATAGHSYQLSSGTYQAQESLGYRDAAYAMRSGGAVVGSLIGSAIGSSVGVGPAIAAGAAIGSTGGPVGTVVGAGVGALGAIVGGSVLGGMVGGAAGNIGATGFDNLASMADESREFRILTGGLYQGSQVSEQLMRAGNVGFSAEAIRGSINLLRSGMSREAVDAIMRTQTQTPTYLNSAANYLSAPFTANTYRQVDIPHAYIGSTDVGEVNPAKADIQPYMQSVQALWSDPMFRSDPGALAALTSGKASTDTMAAVMKGETRANYQAAHEYFVRSAAEIQHAYIEGKGTQYARTAGDAAYSVGAAAVGPGFGTVARYGVGWLANLTGQQVAVAHPMPIPGMEQEQQYYEHMAGIIAGESRTRAETEYASGQASVAFFTGSAATGRTLMTSASQKFLAQSVIEQKEADKAASEGRGPDALLFGSMATQFKQASQQAAQAGSAGYYAKESVDVDVAQATANRQFQEMLYSGKELNKGDWSDIVAGLRSRLAIAQERSTDPNLGYNANQQALAEVENLKLQMGVNLTRQQESVIYGTREAKIPGIQSVFEQGKLTAQIFGSGAEQTQAGADVQLNSIKLRLDYLRDELSLREGLSAIEKEQIASEAKGLELQRQRVSLMLPGELITQTFQTQQRSLGLARQPAILGLASGAGGLEAFGYQRGLADIASVQSDIAQQKVQDLVTAGYAINSQIVQNAQMEANEAKNRALESSRQSYVVPISAATRVAGAAASIANIGYRVQGIDPYESQRIQTSSYAQDMNEQNQILAQARRSGDREGIARASANLAQTTSAYMSSLEQLETPVMPVTERVGRSTTAAKLQISQLTFAGEQNVRGALETQLGYDKAQIERLKARLASPEIAGHPGLEADIQEQINQSTVSAAQTQHQLEAGWLDRLISQAYNAPSNGQLSMSAFTRREAGMFGDIYHMSFGGTQAQMNYARQGYDRTLENMGENESLLSGARPSSFYDSLFGRGANTSNIGGGRISDGKISDLPSRSAVSFSGSIGVTVNVVMPGNGVVASKTQSNRFQTQAGGNLVNTIQPGVSSPTQ